MSDTRLNAFHADAAVRDAALARLSDHIDAKHLQNGSLLWDGEKGSVAGCLINSGDPAEWETQLGLARWLAYALDAVTGRLRPARALEETTALLGAVPLGADTGPLGSALILQLLDAVAAVRAPEGELAIAMSGLQTLHARRVAGEPVEPAAWKALRRAAVAATDAQVPAPAEDTRLPTPQAQQRVVGLAIEAAAWDPQRSATAVSEVLRQWLALEGLKSDEEFGWTDQDDALIRRRLGEMHAKYLVPNPDEKRTVFDFLEIDHAELATRLRAYIKHGGDHSMICSERACALLRRLLGERSA